MNYFYLILFLVAFFIISIYISIIPIARYVIPANDIIKMKRSIFDVISSMIGILLMLYLKNCYSELPSASFVIFLGIFIFIGIYGIWNIAKRLFIKAKKNRTIKEPT